MAREVALAVALQALTMAKKESFDQMLQRVTAKRASAAVPKSGLTIPTGPPPPPPAPPKLGGKS